MNIIGNRLMASSIIKTTDFAEKQTLVFELMFLADFAKNEYEIRYLKFYGVCFYQIEEVIIPLGRQSQISLINDLGKIRRKLKVGTENLEVEIIRQRFEILTTCGKRIIDFSKYEFVEN